MSIVPFKPIGIGMVAAINVFRLTFSQALSSIPIITAYDNYQANSTSGRIFSGTAYYSGPFIAAVGGVAPGSAAWFPSAPVNGITTSGNANRLKGRIYAAAISASVPGAGGYGYFNLGYRIPYDHVVSDTLAHSVVCEYQFTGATPTITWAANKTPGTEATPTWQAIDSLASGTSPTPGNVTKISQCDAGKGYDGTATYENGRPSSFTAYPGEIWLRDY